jgi:signal transduction histidine kinase
VTAAPTILLVDDQRENLVVLQATLAGDDRRLLCATSASDALELLLEEEVALAILDVQIPDLDGFRLAELMRGTTRTRAIPIIFVTAGQHERERAFAGYESGAVDFLEKPIEPKILRSKVGVFVELHRRRQELQARIGELEAVLDAVPAAVFLVRDAATGDIEPNPYAQRLLGVSPGQVLQPGEARPFRLCMDGRELSPEERPVQMAAERGAELRGCEVDVVFDDGRPAVSLYGNATPLGDRRGGVRGSVAAFVDVTRLKQAEQLLRDADRQKDDFIAALSHELRNPLMPINSSLHVLRRVPPGSDAAERALGVIERQARHLARLVDDLLDLTRISRGKMHLRPEPVDLACALLPIIEDHREQYTAAGVELAAELPDTPVVCEVDRARLVQMVGNLLGNAVKFTPAGGHVRVVLESVAGAAVLTISDDGVGIAQEALAELFRPFSQAERTIERSRGGLGLGLSVVRTLAEMHGGHVDASSGGIGRGATFRVRLPLCAARPVEALPLAATGHVNMPRRVLLVDDNVDGVTMTAEAIRLLGHEVHVVHDGPGAVAAARSLRPQVVFCDLGLPGLDGFTLAALLRGDEGGCQARLVAVSGYATPLDRQRSLAAGFDEHIAKPPDIDALRASIDLAPPAPGPADAPSVAAS